MGFGLNFADILFKGKQSLPIILVTITTALLVAFILYKAMKMNSNISVLIGVGSSICGGSAIAAAAPVIGAKDEEIAQSISVIFLFNVIAAVIFPLLGGALGLSNEGFGIFAGTAVNDTSSVTAAATAWDGLHGSHTLGEATIVKLVRTLAIIPITLVLAIYTGRKQRASGEGFQMRKIFPYFILLFLLAAALTTVFDLPPSDGWVKGSIQVLHCYGNGRHWTGNGYCKVIEIRWKAHFDGPLLLDTHCCDEFVDAAYHGNLVKSNLVNSQ